MLGWLADSNVTTLSDEEMTDRERKSKWLWLPLKRTGVWFPMVAFIHLSLPFSVFVNCESSHKKVVKFLSFKSPEFWVSLIPLDELLRF